MTATVRRVCERVQRAWTRLARSWTVLVRGPDALLRLELARASERIEKESAEREAAQAELGRQRARLAELERLDVVASGVAHDLGNLLGAVLGQMQIALAAGPGPAALPHLERALSATRRAADVARELFVQVGLGVSEPRPLQVNELVRENLALFRSSVPAEIDLRAELDADLPLIRADPGQMQQLLMNLILNAAEAIGPGAGRITVSTGTRRRVGTRTGRRSEAARGLPPGSYVRLAVEDTGRGLDEEGLDRIFDPSFTTRRGGRGIGLATVLGVLRAHGGGIEVESAPGQGSVFQLLLPRHADASEAVGDPGAPA